jgi:hypothetical protein
MHAGAQQGRGNCFAETADDGMVFRDDDSRPLRRASRRIVAVSSGLIVATCSTPTSMRSFASAFATSSARMVIIPDEITSTSAPSRSSLALPNSKR